MGPSDFTSISVPASDLDSISSADDEYTRLLAKFPGPHSLAHPTNKHGVEFFLPTKGPPLHARAQRLPPDKLKLAKAEFKKMEELEIIRSVGLTSSYYGAEVIGWVEAFRRLNDVTTPDRYPVPHIQDFSANLASAKIFSKIDLVRSYPDDVPKTAVITPFGLWEFLCVPFGLKMQHKPSNGLWTLSYGISISLLSTLMIFSSPAATKLNI
jgi:hypothetical protein